MWVVWLAVCAGGILAFPLMRHEYFWEWGGSQTQVIDRLAEQGQWQAALLRLDRLMEDRFWDPRLVHRRAELVRDQLVGRRRDVAAAPEVFEAFAAAGRAYFSTSMYPYLLSFTWKDRMASAFHQWAVCATRQGQWSLAALCMEYAADLNPGSVDEILGQLDGQMTDPELVAPDLLAVMVRLTLRFRSVEEALTLVDRLAPGLDEDAEFALRVECELARPGPYRASEDLLVRYATRHTGGSWDYFPLDLAAAELSRRRVEAWAANSRGNRQWAEGTLATWTLVGNLARGGGFEELLMLADAPEPVPTPQSADLEWPLYADGEITFAWPERIEVGEQCWLAARGVPTLGVWPAIEVEVNGQESHWLYVRNQDWIGLPVPVPGGALDTLTVRFLNDGGFSLLTPEGEPISTVEDRNVWVLGLWTPMPSETEG